MGWEKRAQVELKGSIGRVFRFLPRLQQIKKFCGSLINQLLLSIAHS